MPDRRENLKLSQGDGPWRRLESQEGSGMPRLPLLRAKGLGPQWLQHALKPARRAMICKGAGNQNVTILGLTPQPEFALRRSAARNAFSG